MVCLYGYVVCMWNDCRGVYSVNPKDFKRVLFAHQSSQTFAQNAAGDIFGVSPATHIYIYVYIYV